EDHKPGTFPKALTN
nr:Chain B, Rho GTPase-activating protein 7 [Homo sapiens]